MSQVPELFDPRSIENLSKTEIREMISELEKTLMEIGDKMEIPLTHHYSKAVYAREIKIPKGALIVGKIHKHQNLNILSQGEASVLSVDGIVRVKAPYTFVASPGAKRVIYAHEETVWTTIHGTEETDLDKLEDEFIAKNYDELPLPASEALIEIKEETCLG